MSSLMTLTKNNGVLHIEFDSPETRNAMSNPWFDQLAAALLQGQDDPEVRVMLISGRGDLFCAGLNLKVMLEDPDQIACGAGRWTGTQLVLTMMQLTKPVVAAVHGAAFGGAVTLLLSCDFVVAAEGTRFCLPFSLLGINAELASSYLLPLHVGMRKAKEWILLGEEFDAAEALDAGLVNAVVPREQLMERAGKYVERLRTAAPGAVRASKGLMLSAHKAAIAQAVMEESARLRETFRSEEMAEALDARREKRAADFSRFK